MPIELDSHDPDIGLTPGTTKSDIVLLLYENPDLGYRPAEVRDALEIPAGTATTTLTRLYEEEYVGQTADGYYHALSYRDDVFRYVGSHAQLQRMHRERSPDAASDGDTDASTDVDTEALGEEVDALEAELDADRGVDER